MSTSKTKELADLEVFRRFNCALNNKFTHFSNPDRDPPDIEAIADGLVVGVELTEIFSGDPQSPWAEESVNDKRNRFVLVKQSQKFIFEVEKLFKENTGLLLQLSCIPSDVPVKSRDDLDPESDPFKDVAMEFAMALEKEFSVRPFKVSGKVYSKDFNYALSYFLLGESDLPWKRPEVGWVEADQGRILCLVKERVEEKSEKYFKKPWASTYQEKILLVWFDQTKPWQMLEISDEFISDEYGPNNQLF